ncbi:hypothetical protein [Kribbia dieselivorans]|uniref:hypothetical protein n=1 Tax=Kribbia dieselivorans TaxID=331526 RepID=UPI000839A1EF|nr:hypothetical protein [Kribbia dieselivorans]
MPDNDAASKSGESPPTRAERRAARDNARVREMLAVLPRAATVPRPVTVAVAVAGAGLLALVFWGHTYWISVAAIGLLGVVLVPGWHDLLGSPTPRSGAVVLFLALAALIGAVLVGAPHPSLVHLPTALAFSVIVAFLHQLVRRDGRVRVVDSIAVSAAGIVVLASGVTMVVTASDSAGPVRLVGAAAMVAMAVSAPVDLLVSRERIERWLLPVAMLVAAVVAGATMMLGGADQPWAGVLASMMAVMVAHLGRRMFGVLPHAGTLRGQLVAGAASVLAPGMVIHVLAQVLA